MARTPKPWFRKQTGWWTVTLGGVKHKLAEGRQNKKAAQTKFLELQLLVPEAPGSSDTRVASICEAFLVWCERHQAAETYRGQLAERPRRPPRPWPRRRRHGHAARLPERRPRERPSPRPERSRGQSGHGWPGGSRPPPSGQRRPSAAKEPCPQLARATLPGGRPQGTG